MANVVIAFKRCSQQFALFSPFSQMKAY